MILDDEAAINLAKEPNFGIGGLSVRPSRRDILFGRRSISLEPRVMQVLVALAQARGETVSRDTLIARCWAGVVVGEDAIQRCVGRLRRVADETGAFEIETLSRVGYRLVEAMQLEQGVEAPRPRQGRLLAVLPFDNLSQDPDLAYVADGVADEILRAIARRSTIRAIGRTSSFQFRGPEKVVAQISEALGATHILDGSVQKAGERIRIGAHLMDLSDQTMIWSDRFDGDVVDLFDLQETVAAAAVAALDGAFLRHSEKVSRDPKASDLLLRVGNWSLPADANAIGARMRVISDLENLAQDDAETWGRIAANLAALRWVVPSQDEPLIRVRARRAAERALALDPVNGGGQKALFLLEAPIGRFWEQEQRLLAARKAAPEDGEIHWSLYAHFLSVGRLKQSFAEAESAYRVDPLRPANVMAYANALFTAQRETQALALMRHALDRWPDDPIVFAIAGWTAVSAGEHAFVDSLMTSENLNRFNAGARSLIAHACFAIDAIRAPSSDKLGLALARLRHDIAANRTSFSLIGLCAALGGDLEEIYDLVDRADFGPLRAADVNLPPLDGLAHLFLRINGRLRQSPRFVNLCARLGLLKYWRIAQVWPDCVEETKAFYDFHEVAARLSD